MKDYLLKSKNIDLFSSGRGKACEIVMLRSIKYLEAFKNKAGLHRSDLLNGFEYPLYYLMTMAIELMRE